MSSSFSLNPSSKYINVLIYGLSQSGKSSLYRKWVDYSLEKKLKDQQESNHKNSGETVSSLQALDQQQKSAKLTKKQEKELFEKAMREINQNDDDDEDDVDAPGSNSDDDNFVIGPQPEEPISSSSPHHHSNNHNIHNHNNNPHASLIEVSKCQSSWVGANTKCVLFDLPFSSSLSTWKSIYQHDIDCLLYVVDVSPSCLVDENKMKQSAATMWKLIQELNESSWKLKARNLLLIANKIDLLDKNEAEVANFRDNVLKEGGPLDSFFNFKELRNRFSDFDVVGTSAERGEGIYNVLTFISEYVVFPRNYAEYNRKRIMKKFQRN